MKNILLTPGPVESPDEIIDSFNGQTVAHYGKDFRDLYIDTEVRLSNVLGTEGRSLLMPGSGTTALEMIGVNFCRLKKCLVINNGHFGDRIFDIASRVSPYTKQIVFENGHLYDLEKIEEALAKDKYDLLWMVHVDTSIGILNPLKEVSMLAKKYNTRVFVDAIASTAIERIEMDSWRISGIANASQKGFSCPAGLGLLTLSPELLRDIDRFEKTGTWLSDVRVWLDYYEKWNDWHPYPVSLPSNLINALHKSLEILERDGIEERFKLYQEISAKLIRSIKILGLDLFVPKGHQAHGLTAVSTLKRFDAPELIEFLRSKFQIQIGGALNQKMKPLVFRIGHMSTKQCQTKNMVLLISALGSFMCLKKMNVRIDDAISVFLEN